MSAVSHEYGEITVNWRSPSGDWDMLRLTRDSSGFAPRADLGTVLIEQAKTAGVPTSYDDLTGLTPGKFYYYTLWVRAVLDGQWRRAGDVIGLPTLNWGYSARMFQLLPGFYREKDMETPSFSLHDRGDLERFLDIPAYEADHCRTELETLKWINDPDRVSGGLLPLMANQLGFGYEGELGMRLVRQQLRNAVRIYKLKGTLLGVEALVSVLTGWAPTVVASRNIVLDQNDSSWEQGVGQWAVWSIPNSRYEGLTNSIVAMRTTSDASSPGVIAGPVPTPAGASTGDVGSGAGMMMVTAIGAGDMVLQSFPAGTASDNRQRSIPIAASTQYTISIYSRSLLNVRSVRIGVEWFTIAGVSLGAVTENTAVGNATATWTRHSYTITSPATAAYMRVQLRVVGAAATERHVFDALQVETGASATDYQSARSIRLRFTADRINKVLNGGFEVDLSNWTETDAVATMTPTRDGAQFHDGAWALKLVNSATGQDDFMFTLIPGALPLTQYTVSAWCRVTSITAGALSNRGLYAYDTANVATAQTSTLAVGHAVGSWVRHSVIVTTTAAPGNLEVRLYGPQGTVHWDSVMVEQGNTLGNYFDGTTSTTEGEYVWEGTPGNSQTHYYARRLIKNYRLNARLREFLPAGSSWALLYAAQT